EHHRAVLSAASEIARHIEPLARTNRITDEALGRQIGTAEISARELHAAEVEVPDHPRWHRPAMLVEDDQPRIPDRKTDRHRKRSVIRARRPIAHVDRGFGRTVEIVQLAPDPLMEP